MPHQSMRFVQWEIPSREQRMSKGRCAEGFHEAGGEGGVEAVLLVQGDGGAEVRVQPHDM